MRYVLLSLAAIAALVAVAVAATPRASVELVFGWIFFLGRVVPQMGVDTPMVVVGGSALVLFAAGIHLLGRTWRRGWRRRWSLAIVALVVTLFAAGTATIGIAHQLAWMATSKEPVLVEYPARGAYDSNLNLREFGVGMNAHDDLFSRLPAGGSLASDGTMLHSWETQMLQTLFYYDTHRIDMKKPWNHEDNQKYFKCIIPSFINRELRSGKLEDAQGYGLSHYSANERLMYANSEIRLNQIADKSNTILVGEVNDRFKPWGHPVNWRDPADGVNRSPDTFGGPRGSGGAQFLMADGSVRFFSDRTDPDVMRQAAGPRLRNHP